MTSIKAVLLSAGLGTRLRPLTETIPKCLVSVNGRPLLDYWLQQLSSISCDEVIINTHYLSEKVVEYLNQLDSVSPKITLSYEPELLGTAGTLRKLLPELPESHVVLIHADNLMLDPLSVFVNKHFNARPPHTLLSLLSFRTQDPSSCGMLTVDGTGVMTGYEEKPINYIGTSNLANGALFVLTPQFIQSFESSFRTEVDFSAEVLPKLIGKVFVHESSKPYIDIGTPDALAQARRLCYRYTLST